MALIYILEDDTSVRELESYALQGNGFDVCGFENPKQFYEALKKEIPDLVVIDVSFREKMVLPLQRNFARARNIRIFLLLWLRQRILK